VELLYYNQSKSLFITTLIFYKRTHYFFNRLGLSVWTQTNRTGKGLNRLGWKF